MNSRPLDHKRNRLRRHEIGLSVTALADHLGVTMATIRALEGGAAPDNYAFGRLTSYAAALGVEIEDLLVTSGAVKPVDTKGLGATLLTAGGSVPIDALATAMSWSIDQTRLNLDDLEIKLAPAGLALVSTGDSVVQILPQLTDRDRTPGVVTGSVQYAGITIDMAKVLFELLTGSIRPNARGRAMSLLALAGMVDQTTVSTGPRNQSRSNRTGITLTESTRFNLCLDE